MNNTQHTFIPSWNGDCTICGVMEMNHENNTKHTPRPSDVMAYFDLSDEQWDILPDSVDDRLTEIYMKATAAPAMYEALKFVEERLVRSGYPDGPNLQAIRKALAQAEARS